MTNSIQASPQGLNIVERARRKKGWNKLAHIWCDRASISQATLRRFWGGQAIRSENFFSICDAIGVNWEEIADQSIFEEIDSSTSTQEEYLLSDSITADSISNDAVIINQQHLDGLANTDVLSNDIEEFTTLKQLIVQDNQHLVALVCNKTETEAKASHNFENAPPILEILVEIIQFLSNEQKRNLPSLLKIKLLQLTKKLSTSCGLLILDNTSAPEVSKDISKSVASEK
ncbi:hypothetical protein [Fischerella thermalis]|uniref:Uncharacterized protein n=1 Tax=Fischerella thermalis CCMEE 5318 TaxID=2019666 RepID=A0A2N6L5W5_9CYAN|nr:hypothetical protein [Fischerella thermalis]PMB17233.1 hypothetical protein CEN46_24015 [Fischerella thermalis CCMEE 5318]